MTWAGTGTEEVLAVVPEGEYAAWINIYDEKNDVGYAAVYSIDGWVFVEPDSLNSYLEESGEVEVIPVTAGQSTTVETDSLRDRWE